MTHEQEIGTLQCGCRAVARRSATGYWHGWIEFEDEPPCTSNHQFLVSLMKAWTASKNQKVAAASKCLSAHAG